MLDVRHSTRQKVVALAAVALLIAGGAIAAVSATGTGNRARAGRTSVRLHPRDVAAAAAYLGVSADTLVGELDSHKSLAAVAEAHGKAVQGLVDAIVAARRARLAKTAANLPQRIGAEVEKPTASASARTAAGEGGAGRGATRRAHADRASSAPALRTLDVFTSKGRLGATAAAYLLITPAKLRSELRSGRTLAQIASSSPGRSTRGLEEKLLAVRRKRVTQRLATGQIPPARAARITKRLGRRVDALVQRQFVSGDSRR